MKVSIIPFPLCLSKSSAGQEVLVRTLVDLRAKSSANLIGLLHCFESGELQRWLMSIGQNDASRKIAQIDSKQCIRTILVVLKKHLQLPVGNEAIDLTCRKLESPLTLIGWRSLAKFSDIKSKGDLGVLYACWKSGNLARKLAGIGRNDLADEISKMPQETNIRKVLFKLREVFRLTIKTPLIDEFCGAMVPPLNLAWDSSAKKKLFWTVAELRKMSCNDLRGLYECWKSGELARWLADIGQDQIATQLDTTTKPQWGCDALYCLRNAFGLPFSNSDIDNYFRRKDEQRTSRQSVDDENIRPNESCQSTFNNGDLQPKPATHGMCYPLFNERSRIEQELERERVRQEVMGHEQSEFLSPQERVRRVQNEWIRQRLGMWHEQEKQNEVGFGRGKMQIYPGGGGQLTIGGLIAVGLLLALGKKD